MTREEGKILLPVIKGFSEGKTIQHYVIGLERWFDLTGVDLSFDDDPSFYRVKPEPNYRPFNDREECWEEMHKHKPFGWAKNDKGTYLCVTIISATIENFKQQFNKFKFADDSPFGIKEE